MIRLSVRLGKDKFADAWEPIQGRQLAVHTDTRPVLNPPLLVSFDEKRRNLAQAFATERLR